MRLCLAILFFLPLLRAPALADVALAFDDEPPNAEATPPFAFRNQNDEIGCVYCADPVVAAPTPPEPQDPHADVDEAARAAVTFTLPCERGCGAYCFINIKRDDDAAPRERERDSVVAAALQVVCIFEDVFVYYVLGLRTRKARFQFYSQGQAQH